MPLGKLSKKQLEKGYDVLEEIKLELKKASPSHAALAEFSNRFYTVIPHDFGFKKPPIISDQEDLQKKMDLLEVLGDIEIAQKMLASEKNQEIENPIDAKYKLLLNNIEAVEKSSDEWKRIHDYVSNTQQSYSLKLKHVYKIDRHGEKKERFKGSDDIEHRKLLWHGSKVAVFAAILSTGIRIMPHSGGRVGRGLYFADIIAKSASYCGLSGKTGLILLNEVAIGKPNKITKDDPSLVKAPSGFDSVLAAGSIAPDESKEYIDKTISRSGHPVILPQGAIKNTGVKSSFLHNEYLVYDEKQVHMKYLLMLEWP